MEQALAVEETPIWESKRKSVHPALDFTDEEGIPKEKNILAMVTSDRRLTKLNPETTEYNITHVPNNFPRRWLLGSIKSYLDGKETKLTPKRLFEEIRKNFALYIEFPEIEDYDLFSLWILGSYVFSLFKSYPYLYVGGIMQTGKTKVLDVCQNLSFNAIFSGNMSSASLFRLVQNNRCSLFIDESEKLSNPQRAEEFRNLLLSGYKSGCITYRCDKVGDKQIVTEFELFSPKCLANINGLEDVLESRCISIIMQRTLNKEIGEREVDSSDEIWQIYRDQLYFFAMSYWKEIREIYNELINDTGLKNRDWELWKPILAIAKFIDNNLYAKMQNFAVIKTNEAKDVSVIENTDMQLAEILLKLADEESKYVPIGEIKGELLSYFDDEPKWLNSTWVGKRVRRLGFKEGRSRGKYREIRLDRKNVIDLAQRLGIPIDLSVSNPSNPSNVSSNIDTNDTTDSIDTNNTDPYREAKEVYP